MEHHLCFLSYGCKDVMMYGNSQKCMVAKLMVNGCEMDIARLYKINYGFRSYTEKVYFYEAFW